MSESRTVFQPNTQAELIRFVSENAANARRGLRPIGGGTACPEPAADSVIDVRLDQLNRVIDYPARDLTITVEAGIRMAELAKILAAENQRLPIDVPQAEQATLGGVIATNWSGPRRFGHGAMRDYVIGISAVDATGRDFKAGGRVVKNVAGYDLCKLMVGSRGTLAIITQVTLKLRPLAEESAFVCLGFDSCRDIESLLERLQTSATRPVVIDVWNQTLLDMPSLTLKSNRRPMAYLGFEGTHRECQWQVDTVLQECQPFARSQATAFRPHSNEMLATLTDRQTVSEGILFKAGLPPSQTMRFLELLGPEIVAQAHAGNGIVLGLLSRADLTSAQAMTILSPLREFAHGHGGHFSLLRTPINEPLFPASWETLGSSSNWMQKLKNELDPAGLLIPGRAPT